MALFNRSSSNDTNGENYNENYNFNGKTDDKMPSNAVDGGLGFMPPPPPMNNYPTNSGSPRLYGASTFNVDTAKTFVSDFISNNGPQRVGKFVNSMKQGDLQGAAEAIGTENAINLAEQLMAFAPAIEVLFNKDIQPPNSVNGPRGGFTHYHFNNTRLDIDAAPTEVRFDTGIKPDTYSYDHKFAEEGYSSVLHMSSCKLEIPSNSASLAAAFFSDAILFDLRNTIQRNVTFSVDSTLVTSSNLRNTLNAVLYALQVYYHITRFLVYGNNPMNKNEALLYMRSTITSSIIDTYLNLRRVLFGTPIPPNMNTLAFYVSQIYSSNDLPGAPIILISPASHTNGVPSWNEVTTALNGLTTDTNIIKTLSLIGRAIPSWYTVNPLTGIANPLHDPQFCTIWTNLPYHCQGSGYNMRGPSVSGNDSRIYYNSWTNNLDGGAYALTSVWDTSSSYWLPSLFTPVTNSYSSGTVLTSRISWLEVGGAKNFYDAYSNGILTFGRDETYTVSSLFTGVTQTIHQFGCEKAYGVTVRSITNSLYQLLDWMMSWNSVPSRADKNLSTSGPLDMTKGKLHNGGSKSGSNKSRRPRKSKGKKE